MLLAAVALAVALTAASWASAGHEALRRTDDAALAAERSRYPFVLPDDVEDVEPVRAAAPLADLLASAPSARTPAHPGEATYFLPDDVEDVDPPDLGHVAA